MPEGSPRLLARRRHQARERAAERRPGRAEPRAYLGDTVYAALRTAILEREFDPGEPLTEFDLCRRFGTSRTPVREALAKLERDRLVQVIPKKGAFVRTVSLDEIRELYQVREVLEGLAVRLAAPRLEPDVLAAFESRFRELSARGAKTTYTEARTLGEEFHRHLIERSGNLQVKKILDGISEQIRAVWTISMLAPRRVRGLLHEHLALIDALKRGQVRRAERLMIAHVRRGRETIFRLLG